MAGKVTRPAGKVTRPAGKVSNDPKVDVVENIPSVGVEPTTEHVNIVFNRHFSGYNPGEVANFTPTDAQRFLALGVAELETPLELEDAEENTE